MHTIDQSKIKEIMQELADHNADIGAGDRPADQLEHDARNVYMHRKGGITIETLCMMLTDMRFTATRLAAEIGEPPMGSHPDEARPRAKTWHAERLNWIQEVESLRHELAKHVAAQNL